MVKTAMPDGRIHVSRSPNWPRSNAAGFAAILVLMVPLLTPFPSSANPRVERRADVIRPQHDGQHAPPERKVQKADCKQPADDPQASGKTMLFDLDFFHRALLLKHLPPCGTMPRSIRYFYLGLRPAELVFSE